MRTPIVLGLLLITVAAAGHAADPDPSLPHLRRQGSATQLIVDGKPFLIRGGELGNSTATNAAYLQPFWSKFGDLHMNTVLAPVYWDLVEPQEGRFDYSLLDSVIGQARDHDMRLVLLWFASWKNSMSCYAPAWVKRDPKRFPRAMDLDGVPQEILSPFSRINRDTDARAFAALQKHLRQVDGARHTVVMVQVENEIGMMPTARDHSPEADRAFASSVPAELMSELTVHQERLAPEMRALWQAAGGRRTGTWAEVFGGEPAGQEVFMAWHFARYTDAVAAAGKKEYPLPMFVNAAIDPARAPARSVPERGAAAAPHRRLAGRSAEHRSREASINGLYAFGALDAMGFSPFGIESISEPAAKELAASFDLVSQLEPLIVSLQGQGKMAGLLSEGPEQRQPQEVRFGDYVLRAAFEQGAPPALADGVVPGGRPAGPPPPSGGLVLASAPDEFIVGGTAVTVTFTSSQAGRRIGILSAEEGRFVAGTWENVRWLGGDETHQGRHIRLEPGRFSLQRVRLYAY